MSMHKIQSGKNWSDLKTLLQILVALVGFLNGEQDLQKSLNCMHSLMTYEQWLLLLLLLLLATSLTNPFFILSIRYSGRRSFIFFEWAIFKLLTRTQLRPEYLTRIRQYNPFFNFNLRINTFFLLITVFNIQHGAFTSWNGNGNKLECEWEIKIRL